MLVAVEAAVLVGVVVAGEVAGARGIASAGDALAVRCRAQVRAAVDAARAELLACGAPQEAVALAARMAAEQAAADLRRSAVETFARSGEVGAEADRAFARVMAGAHLYACREDALAAAREAFEDVRDQAARRLVEQRVVAIGREWAGPADTVDRAAAGAAKVRAAGAAGLSGAIAGQQHTEPRLPSGVGLVQRAAIERARADRRARGDRSRG